MQEILVDLIRHGIPEGGIRYRGSTIDDPLSSEGWQQMWDAVGTSASWEQIISSPMARCRVFASALAQRHQLPLAIEHGLQEARLGIWEGCTPSQVKRADPRLHTAHLQNPLLYQPSGAEPLNLFVDRVLDAFQRQSSSYPQRRLLLVCHTGVIRAIVVSILRMNLGDWYRIRVDYAGITRIRVSSSRTILETLNAPGLPHSR